MGTESESSRRKPTPRKYRFTPELLDDLRRAYCGNKTKITLALDRLERRTGWPSHAFKVEAMRRGWVTSDHRRNWSPQELQQLRAGLGATSIKALSHQLGRAHEAVAAKCKELALMRCGAGHYSIYDLASLFGEQTPIVRRWVERGLFGKVNGEAAEAMVHAAAVGRFIERHVREYNLSRVNQAWFKAVVFEGLQAAESASEEIDDSKGGGCRNEE